ncbi:hypothetical protein OF83DRAFT_930965 [Amylostereum chailletii]|nr:hypothetical protein OF83DRAFT_930965 [Amylostereum chailletii]
MLQYSVHPPPLSVSFSKKANSAHSSTLKFRPNDLRRINHPQPPPRPPPDDHMTFPLHLSASTDSSLPSPTFPPPKSLPRPVPVPANSHAHATTPASYFPSSPSISPSFASAPDIPDVLAAGDLVGPGLPLLGEPVRQASVPARGPTGDEPAPAAEFEVVRKLGTGSYAVVYLVRELLARPPQSSDDGHIYPGGRLDLDSPVPDSSHLYGREYAIKVLSKANLDQDALDAQLFEATIHQSLPAHPNIVTLHRTFESPSYLLLLLEFVPGEDLFYFLEQSRDHYSPSSRPASPAGSPPASPSMDSRTPPTPGLLSSMHPSEILAPTRLRLIGSMFAQMCEAVAVCHDHGVFHRDIKPENFIVTDGYSEGENGRRERRVIVKLSDFGLSTTDVESSDMDCGSAPYMSYECRNNVAPTYRPRAADVWSLGIVLINMLYHYNPWTDTVEGGCASFSLYRRDPTGFLLSRFAGMTPAVASYLAQNVFCILPDTSSERVPPRDFGAWARDLPALLGQSARALSMSNRGHSRGASVASIGLGHPLGSVPPSRRPSSRPPSIVGVGSSSPMLVGSALPRSMSRAPSLGPVEDASFEEERLAPVLDQEPEDEEAEITEERRGRDQDQDQDQDSVRSPSTKRRKRGARKGKGVQQQEQQLHVFVPSDAPSMTSEILASASQSLARELSRASKGGKTSLHSLSPSTSMSMLTPTAVVPSPLSALEPSPTEAVRVPAKKPSKWKLGFGKGSSEPKEHKEKERDYRDREEFPGRAANVSSLILGLNAPILPSSPYPSSNLAYTGSNARSKEDVGTARPRGRQPRTAPPPAASSAFASSSSSAFGAAFGTGANSAFGSRSSLAVNSTAGSSSETWSRSPVRSSAASSSTGGQGSSANSWRTSMASTNTSSSTFTKYSNPSVRSVSTYATSVSSAASEGNWRKEKEGKGKGVEGANANGNGNGKRNAGKGHYMPQHPPPNVKIMSGVPWELNELPRQLHANPRGENIFSMPPPPRPQRVRKPKSQNLKLEPISEQRTTRADACTSTTDLSALPSPVGGAAGGGGGFLSGDEEGGDGPKKVQKGQINALAKMLGALRR